MKRIGVLTSGGDSPGMNACIRAVVRTGLGLGLEIMGIKRGYAGLIAGEMEPMNARSVGGIIQRGGTILQTSRCEEFKMPAGRRKALRKINEYGVEGLVVIGGDGSLRGALELHRMGFPVVGVPAGIDNDIWGTDMTIGADTALNTALSAIDKIKETASSHGRAFLVEVMGRDCGYLALMTGIAGGAEIVLIPEKEMSLKEVASILEQAYIKGKAHALIVIAEGAKHKASEVAAHLQRGEVGFEVRTTILGHVQRGGSPSAFDRLLATRLGTAAIQQLAQGASGVMVGLVGNKIQTSSLEEVTKRRKELDLAFYDMAEVLAK
ncbi:MAG: 6-phosphofructokinase [Chloroflexota bacterium]|nr:6-phosphofructokinase [Chloroflexota bacterium]